MISELKAGLRPAVNLVYPPRCPLCGVGVAEHGGLCVDCWSELETAPTQGVEEENATPPVIAACLYNDASRDLILRFKHGGKIGLAKLMARMMAAKIEAPDTDDMPLIVPVPLHRLRLWERGYNQSALLAQELAKLGKGDLCLNGLVRQRRTPSLGGLGKAERRRALTGAIAVSSPGCQVIQNRDMLLVDDVFTSGATSSACVDALEESGARRVKIVCFARVVAD